jgi:hypothetical protein
MKKCGEIVGVAAKSETFAELRGLEGNFVELEMALARY